MDTVALRHVPINVSGLTEISVCQRRYPGKIEVWVKFKEESTAVRYNLPSRFLFDTYQHETFSLPQVKHQLLNLFSENDSFDEDPLIKDASIEDTPSDTSISDALSKLRQKRNVKDSSKETRFSKAKSSSSHKTSELSDLTSDDYTGTLIEHGVEERELENRIFNQYQCRIKDASKNGNVVQIWGNDIKRAIKDSNIRIGNLVSIQEIRVKDVRLKSFKFTKI